jgi:cephalosporin hydroxylase
LTQPPVPLIAGNALKASAMTFAVWLRAKIETEQAGIFNIFDKWFARVLTRLTEFDPGRPWEASVREAAALAPDHGRALEWDLLRLRLFLDRWDQGRYVTFAQREASRRHYHPDYGSEFGSEVFLTCQGAPVLLSWRGLPLMKTVFDFALYPMLINERKPRTVVELGSGLGSSAVWFADHLAMLGIVGHVHSVDLVKAELAHPGVTFYQGDCHAPAALFGGAATLAEAPHPWLVVEDAHVNVEAVLHHFHQALKPGDYLVVEDSDVKRDDLRRFLSAYPDGYRVDTRYTDYFGRNATCANDSILVRTDSDGTVPDMVP